MSFVSTRRFLSFFRLHVDHLIIIQRQREKGKVKTSKSLARWLRFKKKRSEKGDYRRFWSVVFVNTNAGHGGH
jgi:hypothetical protein